MVVSHTALHAQKVVEEMAFSQKVTLVHVFTKTINHYNHTRVITK